MVSGEHDIYEAALGEARRGMQEGGIPIGAALARGDQLLASGRNRRIQNGDPTAHAEIDCLRNAGRLRSYADLTLYTTLAPCFLCSGAIILFGIFDVVIGESTTFDGEGSQDLLLEHGVRLQLREDPSARALMQEFIAREPEIWHEDIGEASDPDSTPS
jgi:creatinine deaminase